jgi:hypothetical protein
MLFVTEDHGIGAVAGVPSETDTREPSLSSTQPSRSVIRSSRDRQSQTPVSLIVESDRGLVDRNAIRRLAGFGLSMGP